RLAEMIAGFCEYPLQEMPVLPEPVICQKLPLQLRFDPRYAKIKKLNVIFDLLAEIFDFIETGFQFRIVLILLSAKPEIVAFVTIGPVPPLPRFILVHGLP